MIIVRWAKTLKLISLKVQHLTTFFRKDFMSVQSKIEPFERPMAFQRTASPTHVECEKSQKARVFWIWCPLSWIPFLEKGPPKITEGGPFDPH